MADLTLVQELEASGHLAVISVGRPDGTIHSSLVSAGVLEGPASGQPVVGVVIAGDKARWRNR
jgi:hypothetical protein